MRRFISTLLVSSIGFATLVVTDAARAQSQQPRTRAEVIAELRHARSTGELARQTDELYGAQLPSASQGTLTRAEVVADLQRARSSGELARETDELYGSQPALANRSTLTRAAVTAELHRARATGELARQTDELYGAQLPAAHAASPTRLTSDQTVTARRNAGASPGLQTSDPQ
jgi:hypothetical protein